MKRLVVLSLMILALPAWLWSSGDSLPMSQQDVRMIRDIQSRVYGSPKLAMDAPRGEDLLALADLGAESGSSGLQSQDYDALYALLQRYRDELLKMGMDATDLNTEIKNLKIRVDELQDRIDKLKPVDGLKIDGRVYSAFDDLHLLGDDALNAYGMAPKPPNQGLRYQEGVVHSELQMTLTRGPFSGDIQFDAVQAWGLPYGDFGFRRIYLETRLPVVIQAGNIYAGLTPLTLWRNDEEDPFEPEPFTSRRQRMQDDLLLSPNKWMLTGVRTTTDAVLFGAQHVELENVIAIVSNPVGEFSSTSPTVYVDGYGNTLVTRYETYMDGWRVGLPLFDKKVTLAYNGNLFWDNTSTSPIAPSFTTMNELVQSVQADLKAGIFRAGLEYAMSNYTNPQLTSTAAAAAMTGTAMTYSVGIETDSGHLRAFGHDVSNSYSAAGAQGVTVDRSFEYLGPFSTDSVNLGANGQFGIDPMVPPSYASRYNDTLIPPGVVRQQDLNNSLSSPVHPMGYLLQYDLTDILQPYGDATPNRQGYGIEGDWKFFGGGVRPIASYEQDTEIDAVTDTNTAQVVAPFSMTRIRAGVDFDMKPMIKWPLRAVVGYTAIHSSNGAENLSGQEYDLNTTLMDAGIEYDLREDLGINFGYRHLDAVGINETFDLPAGGEVWDIFGYGLWWQPIDTLRFDVNYSQEFETDPDVIGTQLEVDEAMLRLTLSF